MDNFRRSIISHPTNLNNLLGGGSDSEPSDFYNPNPNYLTIVALEDDCTVAFNKYGTGSLQYSIDGSDDWASYSGSINIDNEHYVSFKGDLVPDMYEPDVDACGTFIINKPCNLTGNCNSILFGDDASTNLDLTGYDGCYNRIFSGCRIIGVSPTFLPATTLASYCYSWMFSNCTSLTTAPILPATTLTSSCYNSMFYNCTSLETAPELPATTLTNYCYSNMFSNCTSLTTAPELPATTLADSCYSWMFSGCTSLTTAPILPATTLTSSCYNSMFYNCTSLETAPELPATTLANYCYNDMFSYCTSLTTAPELPATTLANYCYNDMFSYCSSLITAPELPATTLASYCYSNMFSYCSSLITAPELPATTLANNCYSNMFSNCTSLTTAPELPAITLTPSCYYYMFYGCSKLNYIKAMFTTTPSGSYTSNWVRGVASSGTFIKNKNATWNVTATSSNNYIGIPSGWTVVKE